MVLIPCEGYEERLSTLEGTPIGVVSYPVGDEFVCRVDDIRTGMLIARGSARTRSEAEQSTLVVARSRIATRRRLGETLTELRTRVAALDRRLSEPPTGSKD